MKNLSINPIVKPYSYQMQQSVSSKHFANLSFGNSSLPKSKVFDNIKNPIMKVYDKLTDIISVPIIKVLRTKTLENLVERTKNSKNLVQHITALTAAVLSGFYIKETLSNEKLDKNRRNTLAINQAATTVASTILSYTACKALDKSIQKFSHKFLMLNSKNCDEETLTRYQKGIKSASSIMIFMTIYRFIAPVIVTPIANNIGNKLQEQQEKEAEIEGKK